MKTFQTVALVISMLQIAACRTATVESPCQPRFEMSEPERMQADGSIMSHRATIYGQVTGCSSQPLTGVTVVAVARHMAGWRTVVTDENGQYSLELPTDDASPVQLRFHATCEPGDPVNLCHGEPAFVADGIKISSGAITRSETRLPIQIR